MPAFDLFCVGDSAIDQFLKINPVSMETSTGRFCFTHGAKIPVDGFATSIAGNALNVAANASHIGLKVGLYTEVGEDDNGNRIIKELGSRNISTEYVHKIVGANTNVHAVISANEERTIFSYHEPRDYKLDSWPQTKWLFYSSLAKGFEKFQSELVKHVKTHPEIGVVFNPGTIQMQQGVKALSDVLEVTHVLFVNENEAMKLLGTDISKFEMTDAFLLSMHKQLNKLGPKISVITLGAHGATCYDGADLIRVGIHKDDRPVIDKTGAGDAFTAAFIAAMFYNKSLKECMHWGSINSSEKIRVQGSINGTVSKDVLEKLSAKK